MAMCSVYSRLYLTSLQAQLSQDLQRMTREKLESQNQLALVREEQEQMQANLEQLTKDKWDLSAVNTDLQQRLQQTVTLAHMQVWHVSGKLKLRWMFSNTETMY